MCVGLHSELVILRLEPIQACQSGAYCHPQNEGSLAASIDKDDKEAAWKLLAMMSLHVPGSSPGWPTLAIWADTSLLSLV